MTTSVLDLHIERACTRCHEPVTRYDVLHEDGDVGLWGICACGWDELHEHFPDETEEELYVDRVAIVTVEWCP